jgi:uncharacterized protein
MPSLRHRWLKAVLWLLAIALAASISLAGLDAMRPPARQVDVRVFRAAVNGYHRYLHPWTSRYIRCRFTPTCSNYALEATRKYGIAQGGWLSIRRILACRPSVRMGTPDPVP